MLFEQNASDDDADGVIYFGDGGSSEGDSGPEPLAALERLVAAERAAPR